MLAYADVCGRTLTYAFVCQREEEKRQREHEHALDQLRKQKLEKEKRDLEHLEELEKLQREKERLDKREKVLVLKYKY
jgi:hypothetical protein